MPRWAEVTQEMLIRPEAQVRGGHGHEIYTAGAGMWAGLGSGHC